MIRITFELLPGGKADLARTIGIMEVAHLREHLDGTADYAVAMKKTPPFAGVYDLLFRALKACGLDRRNP